MSRIRSPGYPSAPLKEVVEWARKIHAQDRQYPVSREDAARHMGFAGATGSSDRAISALYHYALAEKVAKGQLRVTDLAMRIMHPDSDQEQREALHEAGFAPDLFRELRDRYSNTPPSLTTLTSYLTRAGFASAAIPYAAKAYLETCAYLQQENAYESVSVEDEFDAASPLAHPREETATMSSQFVATAPSPTPPPAAVQAQSDLELNEPNLSIRGNTVRIEALLDFDGLSELESKIQALKMLMKPSGKASRAVVVAADPAPARQEIPNWDEPEEEYPKVRDPRHT
ncbi:hypothetical protein [Methylobacterium sp. 22177]|uniref:hypothetical protein n=1 Tax=Methylobacterium sp. 22177 TaxID=3453885 RepID=UPI003F854015